MNSGLNSWPVACLFLSLTLWSVSPVLADGDETLGPFSIEVGEGFVVGGTGLLTQPNTVRFDDDSDPATPPIPGLDVPMGVTITRVLAYWAVGVEPGDEGGVDTLTINNTTLGMSADVMGDLIGSTLLPEPFRFRRSYRADITERGLVANGPNLIELSGLDASFKNIGASILVFFENGATGVVTDIRDGMDFAYIGFSGDAQVMVPQVYNFAPADVDRAAEILMIFADGEVERGDRIDVLCDGTTITFCNEIRGRSDPEWDIFRLPLTIPAGQTSVTILPASDLCSKVPDGLAPDSLAWILGALAIREPGGIDIRKQEEGPDTRVFVRGSDVTFEIVVTNTGDSDLTDVEVTDDQVPDCAMTIGDLAVGESFTYTCTAESVMSSFENEACVSGDAEGEPVQDCDPSTVEIIDIDIRKQEEGPDSQMVASGDDASFEVVVTNTGDEDLTNVIVEDFVEPDCDRNIGDLAAGESVTYTCTSTNVTSPFENVACVEGERDGVFVDDCDPSTVIVEGEGGCRVTGGGVNESGEWNGTWALGESPDGHQRNRYTFGGQAGAPTGAQPQPHGEWTHHQTHGPAGRFVFHAGTSSASEGTEISLIECADAGSCDPARPAPAKQIRFEGLGEFQNIHNNTTVGTAVERKTLHFFRVRINDAGEPGGRRGRRGQNPPPPECPLEGFDAFLDPASLVDCACPDFYIIEIFDTPAPPVMEEDPIYVVSGYIRGGNLQIHPSLD